MVPQVYSCKYFFRPVTLDMFPQHVARLHKDSNLLFSAEYDVSIFLNISGIP